MYAARFNNNYDLQRSGQTAAATDYVEYLRYITGRCLPMYTCIPNHGISVRRNSLAAAVAMIDRFRRLAVYVYPMLWTARELRFILVLSS